VAVPTPSDHQIRALTDQVRRADAASSRRREQWMRQQAEEEATFHGLLIDLAEGRADVTVHTRAQRRLAGRLVVVGNDLIVLAGDRGGERTFVPLPAVTTVRPGVETTPALGDRTASRTGTATFEAAMVDLAADRPPVCVHTVDGERTTGTLRRVGRDYLAVQTAPSSEVAVRFPAVNDVIVR
jgi:hypothetical protein